MWVCDAGVAPCCPERKKNPEVRVRQEGRAESDEEGARVGVSFFSHTLTLPYHAVTTDLRRLGGPPVGTDQGAGDTGARSEEHLQREGDSQSLGGPFGGHCQETRGNRSAQRHYLEHHNLDV